MAKIYRVRPNQTKLNQLVEENIHIITDLAYQQSVSQRYPVTNIYQSFTYKMAAKINWHRYGTKLRHCHPVYYI